MLQLPLDALSLATIFGNSTASLTGECIESLYILEGCYVLAGRGLRRGFQSIFWSVWLHWRLRGEFGIRCCSHKLRQHVFCIELHASKIGEWLVFKNDYSSGRHLLVSIWSKWSFTFTVWFAFQILRRPDGQSRGFGFVTYSDEISVEKCLVMRHTLNGKPVDLKRALSRERHQAGQQGQQLS